MSLTEVERAALSPRAASSPHDPSLRDLIRLALGEYDEDHDEFGMALTFIEEAAELVDALLWKDGGLEPTGSTKEAWGLANRFYHRARAVPKLLRKLKAAREAAELGEEVRHGG